MTLHVIIIIIIVVILRFLRLLLLVLLITIVIAKMPRQEPSVDTSHEETSIDLGELSWGPVFSVCESLGGLQSFRARLVLRNFPFEGTSNESRRKSNSARMSRGAHAVSF